MPSTNRVQILLPHPHTDTSVSFPTPQNEEKFFSEWPVVFGGCDGGGCQ